MSKSADLTPEQRAALDDAVAQHRQALAPLVGVEWRAGRTLGTTVYARTGGDDCKADTHIGEFRTPELAAAAIDAHNRELHRTIADYDDYSWLLAAGFCVEIAIEDHHGGPAYRVSLDGGEWEASGLPDPAAGLAAARRWAEGEGITP